LLERYVRLARGLLEIRRRHNLPIDFNDRGGERPVDTLSALALWLLRRVAIGSILRFGKKLGVAAL
jgi:hypothetical protein